MINKRESKLLSVLTAILTALAVVAGSIAVPILWRPFYYAHIDAMNLAETSGYTEAEIRESYDQVLDYLTIPGREFGTGVMPYSESGESHFEDCRKLFFLNGGVLLASSAVMLLLQIRKRKHGGAELAGFSGSFWGAAGAIVLPVVLGGLASLDFDRAFVVFHSVFFPGKDNWIFDYNRDQIIRVLPQDFFMHCAMLVGAGILVFSGAVIVRELWNRKRR